MCSQRAFNGGEREIAPSYKKIITRSHSYGSALTFLWKCKRERERNCSSFADPFQKKRLRCPISLGPSPTRGSRGRQSVSRGLDRNHILCSPQRPQGTPSSQLGWPKESFFSSSRGSLILWLTTVGHGSRVSLPPSLHTHAPNLSVFTQFVGLHFKNYPQSVPSGLSPSRLEQ